MFFELKRKGVPGHRPRALPMWSVPHQIFIQSWPQKVTMECGEGKQKEGEDAFSVAVVQKQESDREIHSVFFGTSSPKSSSAPSFANADCSDVHATAAFQGNSNTMLTSGQEAGLFEEDDPRPSVIGSCGYANFEGDVPPEAAGETTRRIERAGSTPPPTPAL